MKTYSSESIKTLDPLEHIRLRPGMYIGSIGLEGIHHLFNEVLDNAVDEYLAGFGKEIHIIKFGKSLTVIDKGRGIPSDKIVDVFTKTLTGGKFNSDNYATSSGMNGIGLKAVNALSEILSVEVVRDNTIYEYHFNRGVLQSQSTTGRPKIVASGTTVSFNPDPEIFETVQFDLDLIKEKLFNLASVLPGLKLTFDDGENKYEYFETTPLRSIQDRNVSSSIFTYRFSDNVINILLDYSQDNKSYINSFCNTIKTSEDGSHVDAVYDCIIRALKQLTGKIFSRSQISQGLRLTISLFHNAPIYRGQSKSKISDSKVYKKVYDAIYSDIYNNLNTNKDFVNYMVELITQQEKLIQEIDIKKAINNIKSNVRENKLPEKLAVAHNCTPDERELFIVEGNSAGGSVKTARNPKFQEVLPLRGKVVNAMKSDFSSVISNKEVTDIFLAIGGMENTNTPLRTKNVFILTDADDDGSHIYSLLLSMFTVLFPTFVKKCNLYVVYPPLFTLMSDDIRIYGHDTKSLTAEFKKLHPKKSYEIHRNKGLGGMNSEELVPVIHPKSRKIVKVVIDKDSINQMNLLMGNLSEVRKEILNELEVESVNDNRLN